MPIFCMALVLCVSICLDAEIEPRRDLFVGEPPGHEPEDLLLACTEFDRESGDGGTGASAHCWPDHCFRDRGIEV